MTTQLQTITLGGGCFWCTEAAFQMLKGITKVTPGYAGGSVPNPTYYAVVSGKTGHAEVTQVEFDPTIITLEQVLDAFWIVHDPTTLNRQGYDVGIEYRSAIYYSEEGQLPLIKASIEEAQKVWPDPIVTEIAPLSHFYEAEDEHKNYFKKHPERAYCQLIINPKLRKLRENYEQLLAE